MENAKIHVYHGEGKGKTTAAAGLALRMLGASKKVTFCQFLKDGSSSEINALKKFKTSCRTMFYAQPMKFINLMSEDEKRICRMIETDLFMNACKTKCDLLVLDEVLDLIDWEIFDEQLLLYYLDNHRNTEVVLTGRNPSEAVLNRADYVTEMQCIKHPFDLGEPARKGVEF